MLQWLDKFWWIWMPVSWFLLGYFIVAPLMEFN